MTDITGVVQEIQTRSVAGGKTAYNVVVGGQAYGAGLYAPKCKVGDYVKFELDESRGYKNVATKTLQVSNNKPPAEAIAASVATAAKNVGSSFDSRQDSISRQAASNTAISFLQLLAANDALGLPAASAKGKRQDALEEMLHYYERKFYERNTGVKWKDISPETKDAAEPAEPEVEAAPTDSAWT
jgi:hypothetical protein